MNRALTAEIAAHPYPLLFVTISGAHLYGFPSPDSDYDLRGVHVLPVQDVLSLDHGPATIERMRRGEPEIDLVTHDAEKFFRLMLRPNGYVLEQLYSPLVLHTTSEHEELKRVGTGCITSRHVHHYRGFAENQWRLFERESPRRVKPLLYVFRVLLTGIHLMNTGVVEANLVRLNAEARLPFVAALIERKTSGERATLDDRETLRFADEYHKLMTELVDAAAASNLPGTPSARPALNDLLLRLRSIR